QAQWTIYYFEGLLVLSVLAALGISAVIDWSRARVSRLSISRGTGVATRALTHPVALAAMALVLLTGSELHTWRQIRQRNAAWTNAFAQLLSQLPKHPAVVFVHYAPRIGPHAAVVTNSPS